MREEEEEEEEEEKVEEKREEKEKQKRATIASAPDDEQNLLLLRLPIFLAALRKAATDRREKASIARSRKGELNTQKAAEKEGGVSYLKFAARATEMTRTQKRINRGGY